MCLGIIKEQAVGKVCWVCGTTSETWPLLDQSQIPIKYAQDKLFKNEFDTVRAAVKRTQASLLEQISHVFSLGGVSLRVIRREAFLDQTTFESHFGFAPGAAGTSSSLSWVPGFDGDLVPGGVVQLPLPKGINYDIVERCAYSEKTFQRTLLGPSGTFRPAQPQDRYKVAVKNAAAQRSADLKRHAPPNQTLKIEAVALEDERRQQAGQALVATSVSAPIVSASSLCDKDSDVFSGGNQQQVVSGRRVGARALASAPPTGGRAIARRGPLVSAAPAAVGTQRLSAAPGTPASGAAIPIAGATSTAGDEQQLVEGVCIYIYTDRVFVYRYLVFNDIQVWGVWRGGPTVQGRRRRGFKHVRCCLLLAETNLYYNVLETKRTGGHRPSSFLWCPYICQPVHSTGQFLAARRRLLFNDYLSWCLFVLIYYLLVVLNYEMLHYIDYLRNVVGVFSDLCVCWVSKHHNTCICSQTIIASHDVRLNRCCNAVVVANCCQFFMSFVRCQVN